MEIIGWVATILSILGIILNGKKLISCWYVWTISNILWIIYFIYNYNPQSILLWGVFIFFNIYGWLQWRKDDKRQEEYLDGALEECDSCPVYGDEGVK